MTPPRALLLVGLLAGCLPKTGPVVSAPEPTPTAVAASLSLVESGALEGVPDGLDARVVKVLEARNLVPQPLDDAAVLTAFGERRVSRYRLDWMAEQASAPLLLLLETEVEFYSQLSGRYRWTVRVTATVAPRDDLTRAVSSSFEVPVFLQYHHEKEQAALEQAAPVIERQLGHLLDEVLGGL